MKHYIVQRMTSINAEKLRAVIQGFKKNGIHVVIVSARDSRKSALKALTDAYGENRDFLLVNDIYDREGLKK